MITIRETIIPPFPKLPKAPVILPVIPAPAPVSCADWPSSGVWELSTALPVIPAVASPEGVAVVPLFAGGVMIGIIGERTAGMFPRLPPLPPPPPPPELPQPLPEEELGVVIVNV